MKLQTLFILLISAGLFSSCTSDRAFREDQGRLADEVRQEFLHSWNAYKKYAWGHDMLRPVSKAPVDWYKVTLLMTPIDALDTMILMGLKEEADATREYIVSNLSFDHDIYVKNFEITIRLLGGLLSNYQLTGDKRLLAMADDLGRRLMPVFKSPTGIPYVDVNLKTGEVRNSRTNPAEVGTLIIEFGTLSKLTGKPEYYDAAKNALVQIYKRRSSIGLVGTWIDANTGQWLDRNSHVSACIDSYYEYLLKGAILFGDPELKQMWEESKSAVMKHLADEAPSGLWIGHADMETGKRTHTWFGLLDAFFPAVLALSGDVATAERLQESSFKMWNKYGIECERFDYLKMDTVDPRFQLNPEIIESAYYLYHYTKNPRYLEMGRTFLSDLKKYCRMDEGYSGLKNVATKERSDLMESYFLAESLKYLYLLFAPPETLEFERVVFNTEAHPIRKTW
ncbi:MAG TPA: glycoside hydrolase family 47 [Bacteroidetes bacterium]|nr:glycoside hydrolase family 47 [Bacteroidota bacterium]